MGRQTKRWEDNIKEGTCLDFNRSQRAAEDRHIWPEIVIVTDVMEKWCSYDHGGSVTQLTGDRVIDP